MAEYDAEPVHVGRRIAAHREQLGVGLDEMKRAVSTARVHALLRVERIERPRVADIEIHHAAMIAVWVESETAPAMQLARREQWYATELDDDFWSLAKTINPAVTWWWGPHSKHTPRGAWCYLCTELIHPYDVGRGVTRPARLAVMNHRAWHYGNIPAITTSRNTETSA